MAGVKLNMPSNTDQNLSMQHLSMLFKGCPMQIDLLPTLPPKYEELLTVARTLYGTHCSVPCELNCEALPTMVHSLVVQEIDQQ